jgi:hypothetical protein
LDWETTKASESINKGRQNNTTPDFRSGLKADIKSRMIDVRSSLSSGQSPVRLVGPLCADFVAEVG